MTSFYSEKELSQLGLKNYGMHVLISRKCSIYSPETISIGNNVRIDDFSILSGNITLGSNIHISAYCALYGAMGIQLKDYTGMSPHSIIFSCMDDFSGDYLIGPIHEKELINVTGGRVLMEEFAQLGCNTIVFPNLVIKQGAVTGALSLVNSNLEEWTINVGIPAKKIKDRKRNVMLKINNDKL